MNLLKYILKLFCQLGIYFILFMVTHYWMKVEDINSQVAFSDLIVGFLHSSFFIGVAIVVVINLFTVFSNHWTWQLIGLLIGVLQFYLNFTYFEYYLVFQTPLYGKDIVSMKDPTAVWELSKSMLNFNFLMLVVLPTVILSFTLMLDKTKKLVRGWERVKRAGVRLMILLLCLWLGYSSFKYYDSSFENFYRTKFGHRTVGYLRNPILSMYEAIANYLQFKVEVEKPQTPITEVRVLLKDKEQRKFVNDDYPLLQSSTVLFKNQASIFTPTELKKIQGNTKKNIIVIMFESLMAAEIEDLNSEVGADESYKGLTPFFSELNDKSIVFENVYASGLHTYYGFNDILNGVPDFDGLGWHRKVNQKSFSHGLPNVLKVNGYLDRWLIYGGNSYFDNQVSFSRTLGFEKDIHEQHFTRGVNERSNWGFTDLEVFTRAAKEIKKMHSPFMVFIQGLTKHSPYHIPSDFDEAGFKKALLKGQGIAIDNLKAKGDNSRRFVYYANQVLESFFNDLKGHSSLDNAIVIITSDQGYAVHVKSENQFELMRNRFRIPLIYYEKGITPRRLKMMASHLDIIPTLINRLKLKTPKAVPYFGKNLFNSDYEENLNASKQVSFFTGNMIRFVEDGFYQKKIGTSFSHFDLALDERLTTPVDFGKGGVSFMTRSGELNNLRNSQAERDDLSEMSKYFKAYEEIYPYLIHKNLVFPDE